MEDPDKGLSPSARDIRRAGPVLAAVWRFTGGTGVGIAAGLLLDRWLHTSPLCVLVGLGVGMSVGFYAMYKALAVPSK